jgi:hypothetical protein
MVIDCLPRREIGRYTAQRAPVSRAASMREIKDPTEGGWERMAQPTPTGEGVRETALRARPFGIG